MMTASFENMIPWDLISSALEGQITTEEERQLQQWISSNDENRGLFDWLKQTWENEFSDYKTYKEADETIAWDTLRLKLERRPQVERKRNVVTGDFTKKTFSMPRWAAVAAVLIIALGSFLWYFYSGGNNVYQTGFGEQRTVSLPDGSSIKLYQDTRIEIEKDYNKLARVVTLKTGEAFFEVIHNEQVPFTVNMGTTSVRDIGTSFFVYNRKDSIKLSVTSGKVAFINNADNESRELSAGMSLQFQTGARDFAPAIFVDSAAVVKQSALHFANTALADVIVKFQEVYHQKIVLMDTAIAQKRFTAHLDGQSFAEAMDILSKTLNIKYFSENGVYYLKKE